MPYEIGTYRFDLERFFPKRLFERITDIRVHHPDVVYETAQARRRRPKMVGADGNLMILAADHPARRITASAGDPLVMGDRRAYLGRILRIMADPRCDGVLGTPDIIEDLLIVDHLIKQAGGASLLDGRVLAGTMNRGGLAGTAFEMADTFTAYTAQGLCRFRLDAAKVMFRLDVDSPDALQTITQCSQAVTDCVRSGLPIFIEPLPVRKTPAGYEVLKSPADLIQIVGVASALGESSLGTWIKIPYTEDYPRVTRSTTCPILMLGGESRGNPAPTLYDFADGMAVGGNVRGAMVGRNVHHPGADDPLAVALAVYSIVHEGCSGDEAVARLMGSRNLSLDALTRYVQ